MFRGALRRRWNLCLSAPAPTRQCARTYKTDDTPVRRPEYLTSISPDRERYQPQNELRQAPRKALQAANIGVYSFEVRQLKLRRPASKQFATFISTAKRHVIHQWQHRYVEADGHPMAWFFAKILLKDDVKPLWWKCTAYNEKSKIIVRAKCETLLRRAFRTALKNHGYDETGRRIPPASAETSSHGRRTSPGEIYQLYGTVHIRTLDPVLLWNAPYEKLLSWMDEVVEQLEAELGETKPESRTPTMKRRPKALPGDKIPKEAPNRAVY